MIYIMLLSERSETTSLLQLGAPPAGCWAYPDMLQVGRLETEAESRTHFAAVRTHTPHSSLYYAFPISIGKSRSIFVGNLRLFGIHFYRIIIGNA